jgi:hypothetical protein
MDVTQSVNSKHGSVIEFGNSSWDLSEQSIRLRWDNNGKFDPFSSSQLPLWALEELITRAVDWGAIDRSAAANMIKALAKAL